ncbi:MAG: hypothetical protein H7Y04_07415 [Verrucomicrobia bacterium]|nr:hypothetical protein [Cytophagales bacterium]
MNERFVSSRLRDPFTPDEVIFNEKGVTFKINKLIGGTESFVFYGDISGVEIDNGILFATLRVIPKARTEIIIENLAKDDAQQIKKLILERV